MFWLTTVIGVFLILVEKELIEISVAAVIIPEEHQQPSATKLNFLPDITSLKLLDIEEIPEEFRQLADLFDALYLSLEASELGSDFSFDLGSLKQILMTKSDLILSIKIRTLQNHSILLDKIEEAFQKHDLENRCKMLLLDLNPDAYFEGFNYTSLRSNLKQLFPHLKIGLSMVSWDIVSPILWDAGNVSAKIEQKISFPGDAFELSANFAGTFVSYSLFEEYIDSLFGLFASNKTGTTEAPLVLIRISFQPNKQQLEDSVIVARYVCLQIEMMNKFSMSRNMTFVLSNLGDTGIMESISSNVRQGNTLKPCLEEIDFRTSVTFSSEVVPPYVWIDDDATTERLLDICRLFSSTYSSISINLGWYNQILALAPQLPKRENFSLGFSVKINSGVDADMLNSVLLELSENSNNAIKNLHMSVTGLLFYLQHQKDVKSLSDAFNNTANDVAEVADEFKAKLRQANLQLVTYFESDTVAGAVSVYAAGILGRDKTSYVNEAIRITDRLLWAQVFSSRSSEPNLLAHQYLMEKFLYINAVFSFTKMLHPNTQSVLGIFLPYVHIHESKTCKANTGLTNAEFLDIVYQWAAINDIKVTECAPFTMFDDQFLFKGRWLVAPRTSLKANGSVLQVSDVPCIKSSPNALEKSTYSKLLAAGISYNLSPLQTLVSKEANPLLQIVASRFSLVELVVSKESDLASNGLCGEEDAGNIPLLHMSLNQDTNEPQNLTLYVSMEQEINVESITCLTSHAKAMNKSLISGVSLPIFAYSTQNLGTPEHKTQLLDFLDHLQKKKIAVGAVFQNCSHAMFLEIPTSVALAYVKYIICNVVTETGSKDNPFNFARVHYQVDIARALQIQIQSQKEIWTRSPKVMLRIGFPKVENINATEANGIFLKFFHDVHEITKAYQIPFFIKEAFETNNSEYAGWWYGDTANISSITERESEFLESATWRPMPPKSRENSSSSNTALWIGLSVSFFVFTLAVLVGLAIILRIKYRNNNVLSSEEVKRFFVGEDTETAPKYDIGNDISWEEIKLDKANKVGSGQFGIIYATTLNGENVAVKVAKERNKICVKSIMSEIKIMMCLDYHVNILKFVGAYTQKLQRGIVCLVTEFCESGTLHAHLQSMFSNISNNRAEFEVNSSGTNSVSLHELCRFCHEIAAGMDFLGKSHVVHGDLSARNVLLNWQLTCKISDFGLSRKIQQYKENDENKTDFIPWRWMAIEALSRFEFTVKSDVWSFGVTAWEVFSLASLPFAGRTWNEDFASDLTNGLRLNKPTYASDEIYKILTDCWHLHPESRPEFSMLREIFKKNCSSDYVVV